MNSYRPKYDDRKAIHLKSLFIHPSDMIKWLYICCFFCVAQGSSSLLVAQISTYDEPTLDILRSYCDMSPQLGIAEREQVSATERKLYCDLHSYLGSTFSDSVVQISLQLETKIHPCHPYSSPFYHIYGRQRITQVDLYDQALEAFHDGLLYAQDSLMEGLNYMYIGYIYTLQKQYKPALEYFTRAEEAFGEELQLELARKIYNNKGLCYIHTKAFEQADLSYQRLLSMEKEKKDSLNLSMTYTNLANLYYEQYLDEQAIQYFEQALGIAEAIGDFKLLRISHRNMAVVRKNNGELEDAYKHMNQVRIMQDSLYNDEKVYALATQEKKFLEQQKNAEILLLQKDNQLFIQQRNIWIIIAVGIILILLLLFYQYRSSLEKNKLISAQKLQVEQLNDTKDELLSVLGHDLRSPMQHLITIFDRGFDTLERGERAPMLKLLQQGSVTTNKTYLLLDNVLQWVMQQQNDKSVTKHLVKLQPVIRELKETFHPIIETKQIQVSNHIEPDATVYADRGTLKIILRNLMDNALKFTPKKGKIAFHLVSSDGDMTAIQVQDNGRGMSIEKVKQLFHHSAPTKDTGGRRSTGLGLKLCQSFAKKNGGQLQVESKEGEGSTFTLWLPNSL